VESNVAELGEILGKHASERVAAFRAWTERETATVSADLEERAAGGAHRECHGDLHLENLLVTDGRIVAFDALEFDAKLREIDVVSESSFTAMDLLAHGRADLAYAFLNRYFEVNGDYAGLRVLRYYLVYRALVRAKVRAIKAAQSAADGGRDPSDAYLDLAAELCAPRRPLLVITHGLSGSGKTHITGELLGRVPALRVRSDLERKRLLGLDASAKTESGVGSGAYDPKITERTYARLARVADDALAHSLDMIVDATFLRAEERAEFRALAARRGARFAILDCAAPEAVLRERIAARAAAGRDASEATTTVLDHQLASRDALSSEELEATVRADTAGEIDFAALARALNKPV
jgi:predicted kinase